MEKMLLKAEVRKHTGTIDAARIRKQGSIPAVVYGHKQEPISISVNAHDFTEGIHHGHRIMEVQIGKKKETVIIKEVQYDHLGRDVIHADLMRVDVTERITVAVPIELKGIAKGTTEGGIVETHADRIEIECLVTEIPEKIIVSIKELGVGQVIHASDIQMAEGIKLVSSPETLIAACSLLAVAKTTEELEGEVPMSPEVIGREKKEEGESSEEEA